MLKTVLPTLALSVLVASCGGAGGGSVAQVGSSDVALGLDDQDPARSPERASV